MNCGPNKWKAPILAAAEESPNGIDPRETVLRIVGIAPAKVRQYIEWELWKQSAYISLPRSVRAEVHRAVRGLLRSRRLVWHDGRLRKPLTLAERLQEARERAAGARRNAAFLAKLPGAPPGAVHAHLSAAAAAGAEAVRIAAQLAGGAA